MTRTLKEILLDPAKRPQVVADAQQLIDDEVSAKQGVSGMAVKTTYGMVKALRPGIIRDAVDSLLDDLVSRLEPFYADFQNGQHGSLSDYLVAHADQVSDALLGVTDERAAKTSKATIKKAYDKLRPQAKKNVEEALPALGRLIEKHA